jgi:hypothetical protein
MRPDLTPDIEQMLARQILSIEEARGHLTRTRLVGEDEQTQVLILIFADGRWASILPTRHRQGTGWSTEHVLGLHIQGTYGDHHACYGHMPRLETLYHAGLLTEEQWQAHQDLQQRRRAEQAKRDAIAAQQRQQANQHAKEAAEERRREQLTEEFYKALRLKVVSQFEI